MATKTRAELKAEFIKKRGWETATVSFLAGDCSNRIYDRLTGPNEKTAVLMDAYGPDEKVKPFIAISKLLNKLGCAAPKVLASNLKNRFLLLEDFGDETFTACLNKGGDPDLLYDIAIQSLIQLHRTFDITMMPTLPVYDLETLLEKANLFLEWYFPSIHGAPPSPVAIQAWQEAWHESLQVLVRSPKTIILRDFHVDNLIWLKGRKGPEQCGLLDFQDASLGPQAYDLVSLFEDVRRDVCPQLTERLLQKYLSTFPILDEERFMAQYYTAGAQRATRIIGVFSRMLLKQKRDHYMRFIPRAWKWLENDLKHDNLLAIRRWFDEYFPAEKRRAIT